MTARIDRTLPFADYLRADAYGSSDLKAFRVGPPAMVPWRRANRVDTTSTRVGTAAHCAILTPDLFDAIYAIKPDGMSFATKEGKAWREEHGTRDILTWDEATAMRGIVAAFHQKPASDQSLRGAIGIESSVFWECAKTGLPCKARPDWFDVSAVYELKASIVADRGDHEKITFAAYREGWMHQLAHNRAGMCAAGQSITLGRIVVISPNPPHSVWLLEVSENDMDFLEMDNTNTRLGMAECHRTGHWPGTPDSWHPVELPASAAFTESDLEGATDVLMQ